MPKKYGSGASHEVEKEMRRFKRGTAESGRSHKPVKSRSQAIAIALSKARKKGDKVPMKATTRKTTARKTTKRK